MPSPLQWTRSLVFNAQMYLAMLVVGLGFAPAAAVSQRWALRGAKVYARYVMWSARKICGLSVTLDGPMPEGAVIVAAKHQSFFDVLVLMASLPQPRFVLKDSLLRVPLFGWYARRMGCIAVDRASGGKAMMAMLREAIRGDNGGAQLVIYPQGTRVAPGVKAPYKPGVGLLYARLGQPVVPVATNVGMFWPRQGVLRRKGEAFFAFLPEIAPGMSLKPFMETLEAKVEHASMVLEDAALAARGGPSGRFIC